MPPEVYIPGLVAQLRERPYGEWGAPAANVSANHVFCGEIGDYHGGPYGEPASASPFNEAKYGKPAKGAPEIAVIDTGYDTQIQALHPGLNPRVVYQPGPGSPENPLTGGYLAQEAGHGTFIDGVIMQLAPQVSIRQVQVLSPAGDTDDVCVALAITSLGNSAPVINLSLGGYTQQDTPPPASSAAIAALPDTVVVVAAAGNNQSPELFWPAAGKTVVSVGALDTTHAAALGRDRAPGGARGAQPGAVDARDRVARHHRGAGVHPAGSRRDLPGVIALPAVPEADQGRRGQPRQRAGRGVRRRHLGQGRRRRGPLADPPVPAVASRALTSSGSGSSGAMTALAPTASSAAASPVISSPGPAVDSAESQAASMMVRGALPRRSRSYTVSGPSASSSEENSGLSARKLPCAATCATSAPSSARSAALTVASRPVSTCAPG